MRCIAPGKRARAQAFGPDPSPETGERNRCQRLRSLGTRLCQEIAVSRTKSCDCAPASRSRAAASRADWPAPITATLRPLKDANEVIPEVWVISAGGKDASTRGTLAKQDSPVAITTRLAAKRSPVASVIAGATRPEQLEQNVKAGSWTLTADELAEIDRIAG